MADLSVETATRLNRGDLAALCEATEISIEAGIGFGWVKVPSRQRLEAYWKGVLIVPERELFIGRLDGTVAGSVQLVKPPPNFEVGVFATSIETHFVAPWARGHGLAVRLLGAAEDSARALGYSVMRIEVRATQERAIQIYETGGYTRWATLEKYHMVDGEMVPGYFYIKDLV